MEVYLRRLGWESCMIQTKEGQILPQSSLIVKLHLKGYNDPEIVTDNKTETQKTHGYCV